MDESKDQGKGTPQIGACESHSMIVACLLPVTPLANCEQIPSQGLRSYKTLTQERYQAQSLAVKGARVYMESATHGVMSNF